MKVLVTGANGLLGQKLVKLLVLEVTLYVTGRGPNRNPDPKSYTYLPTDLTDRKQVNELIQKTQPEAIIHCAAMTQVDACEQNQDVCWAANVSATQYLLEACQNLNIFFLYISTDFVFDGTRSFLDEAEIPRPISFYGESKLKAEQLVQSSKLRWAIARTVLVYGVAHDMSRSNIILWVKKSLEEKKTIQVVNDQYRTPTLAEDLAQGCWLIVKDQQEGIFHLSGEELMTPYEIALKTAKFFNLDAHLITPVDASTFTQPGKRPPRTGFNIQKARSILGFKPHTFEEGLDMLSAQLGEKR